MKIEGYPLHTHTKSSVPYYDGLSEDYDKYYAKHNEHAAEVLPNIVKKLTNGVIQRILDIGAGTGAASIPLAKSGHTVVGIDNCERMVNLLRDKINQLNLEDRIFPIKADILDKTVSEYLPGTSTFFDGIVFWGNGLCHISPDDYTLLLTNVKRLLKPNGWLLLDYRSGERMRSRGTHIEILFENPTEIRLSCVHSVPEKGYGPIHRALVSIRVSSSNGTDREPRMTKASFNSIWPYLVDDAKLEEVLMSENFLKKEHISTSPPLSDMVTDVYWLNQNG